MTMPGPSTRGQDSPSGREKQVPAQLTNLDKALDGLQATLMELFTNLETVREARPVDTDDPPDQPTSNKMFNHIEGQVRKVSLMTRHTQQVITELEL